MSAVEREGEMGRRRKGKARSGERTGSGVVREGEDQTGGRVQTETSGQTGELVATS